jgi:hypothetical protein
MPTRAHLWGMEFAADQLLDGGNFRIPTIVDNSGRKYHGYFADQHVNGEEVVKTLNSCAGTHTSR